MKQTLAIIFAIVFISSCISPKRYAGMVKDGVRRTDKAKALQSPDLVINLEHPSNFDSLVRVYKGDNYFIPALVYWGVKETFLCELNKSFPKQLITNEFVKYADKVQLHNKLNGRHLEITLSTVPGDFTYTTQGDIIFIGFYAFTINHQTIFPKCEHLTVTYKLLDGTKVIKEDAVAIRSYDENFTNNIKSTRGITRAYLAKYEENLARMSRECIDKIYRDL